MLESCAVSVSQDDPESQDLPIEDNDDLPNEGCGVKCYVCIKTLKAWKMKKDVDEKAT